MEKHILSKSTFIRGAQCLKSLYLHKKRYFLRDPLSDEQRLKFKRGFNVGIFAQQLYPGGINVRPGSPAAYRKALERTSRLIEEGAGVIYEAGFQHNKVLVFLDVLIKENNSWKAIEVKSSRQISPTYMLDAALQYYVINGCGLELEDFSIVHINEDYILGYEIDPGSLFKSVSVIDEIKTMQPEVSRLIEEEKVILDYKHSPAIDIGPHCHYPYPCDFTGHCWKEIPWPSVFNVTGLSMEEKFNLYKDNIRRPKAVLEKFSDNTVIRNSCMALIDDKPYINRDALKQTTKGVSHPIAYLYMLTHKPAIPYIQGSKPYQSIAYGYFILGETMDLMPESIHEILKEPDQYSAFLEKLNDKLNNFNTIITFDDLPPGIVKQKKTNLVLKRPFENGDIIYPGIREPVTLSEVADRIFNEPSGDDIIPASDLLASDIFETYLQTNDPGPLEQISGYGTLSVSTLKKLWEWVDSFSN